MDAGTDEGNAIAACSHCGAALRFRLCWQAFADGRKHIRAERAVCGHYQRFAEQTPEAVAEADANPAYGEKAKAQQGSLFGDD